MLFKKLRFTDDFISLGYLSINFNMFMLKMIFQLLTPIFLTIWINLFFSLYFLSFLPYWYVIRIMFVFFFRIISLQSLIVAVASSNFSNLLAISSKFSDSTFSLSVNELINCSLILS